MKIQKYFRWTLRTVLTLILLFIVGLFAGLPVIPLVENNYFIKGKDEHLGNGVILKRINNAIIKVEIPDYFSENGQCIDTWFASSDSSYTLNIDNFSFEAVSTNDNILKRENSYLFWENGSKENEFKIQNHTVSTSNSPMSSKYVFLRTVYNLDEVKELIAKIKIDFQINGKAESFEQSLPLVKKQKLIWSKFRVH